MIDMPENCRVALNEQEEAIAEAREEREFTEADFEKATKIEEHRKYMRKWNKTHAESRKLSQKKWREKNLSKINAYVKGWRAKNKGSVKKSRKKHYLKNKKAIMVNHNKCCKKYYHTNPSYKKKVLARTKARTIKIPQGQICEMCKKFKAVEKHHKNYDKPLEVVFLCKGCHREVKNG
jgi:hypothetical protein